MEFHKQIEAMMSEQLQQTARYIQQNTLPEDWAFLVCMAPFNQAGVADGDIGVALYVSNANREDAIKMLRETADNLEKQG